MDRVRRTIISFAVTNKCRDLYKRCVCLRVRAYRLCIALNGRAVANEEFENYV